MTERRAKGTLRRRGRVWTFRYYVGGVRYEEGTATGDERAARALAAERRREIREGTWVPPKERRAAEHVLTTEAYLEAWLERRETAGVRNVRDERQWMRTYVIPEIGSLPLVGVKRDHVKALVAKLTTTTSARTGRVLSTRTVIHVYRTLTTAFADAVLSELIPATPCTLRQRRGELPKKRDARPGWRAEAVYTRAEAEQLLEEGAVPTDRRALYAMMLLAGLRGGEAAGARWRAYDETARPLGRLTVATQAEGATGERETKTGDVREVPIHPELERVLEAWRREGFALAFGRAPRPEDPIVPSTTSPPAGPLRFRSGTGVYQSIQRDLDRLGIRRVPSLRHAMRATFLTLLESDGANMSIARRATHAPSGDVVAGYVRTPWADLCREIAKLRVDVRGAPRSECRPAPDPGTLDRSRDDARRPAMTQRGGGTGGGSDGDGARE